MCQTPGLRCSEDSHLVGTWAELAFRPESRSKAGPTAMLHRRASPRLCSERSFRRSFLRPSIQIALEVAPTLPARPSAWAPGSGREGDALISAGAFSGSFSWIVCPGVSIHLVLPAVRRNPAALLLPQHVFLVLMALVPSFSSALSYSVTFMAFLMEREAITLLGWPLGSNKVNVLIGPSPHERALPVAC